MQYIMVWLAIWYVYSAISICLILMNFFMHFAGRLFDQMFTRSKTLHYVQGYDQLRLIIDWWPSKIF